MLLAFSEMPNDFCKNLNGGEPRETDQVRQLSLRCEPDDARVVAIRTGVMRTDLLSCKCGAILEVDTAASTIKRERTQPQLSAMRAALPARWNYVLK
jgi:hypothetical protein